jgi:predicted ATP-dependent endonuclease of OLD family
LKEIREAEENVIEEASEIATQHIAPIQRLIMGTPSEVPSLLSLSGFSAETSTGALIRDDSLGAGSQAYIMFLLLKTIDTNYGGTFGWRQGVVWAVEEPESSLHKDLEQKLAIMLSSWSEDEKLKIQVLATTHSETIITAANKGFLVELDQGRTIIRPKEIPELVFKAAAAGISGPVEPMLCFPTNPVVLVEGPLDRMILEKVAERTRTACAFKFLCLHELDPSTGGSGVDAIITYLKQHGRLAQNRAIDSPIIVIFDNDIDEEKLRQARKYYGTNGDHRVLRMDVKHADNSVSDSIGGIERFYPKELFVKARKKRVVAVSIDLDGVVHIERNELTSKVKNKPANMLCDGPASWCKHLKGVLGDIQTAALSLRS